MATAITKSIEQNITDTELRSWILPNFTTTAINAMMATMKEVFSVQVLLPL
jgi:hypothetical protein